MGVKAASEGRWGRGWEGGCASQEQRVREQVGAHTPLPEHWLGRRPGGAMGSGMTIQPAGS